MLIDRLLRQALLIVALGAGVGLAANQLSPRGIPLIAPPETKPSKADFIPLEEALMLWRRGDVLFLDARAPEDYASGHIGAAVNLPAMEFEQRFPHWAPLLAPNGPLVIYCDGTECDLSRRLLQELQARGFTNGRILSNGWTVWRQAGLPTATGEDR